MTTTAISDHAGQTIEQRSMNHVTPWPVLLAVFAALIVLTVVTVGVAGLNLGRYNVVVALGIATVKAALVALYFMHLKYDHPFNGFIVLMAVGFLALFLTLTLIDTWQYQPDIRSYQDAVIQQAKPN